MSLKNNIASILHRLGFSATFLTLSGLALAGLSGYLISQGELFWAAATLLLSGLLDLMDGAVARTAGTVSKFGGILDSSLDRYGDGFIFGGIIYYFYQFDRPDLMCFAFSGWIAAFSISYVRARAECEIGTCRVGFWERGERIGFTVIALLTGNLELAALILGIFLHWTVFQRLYASNLTTGPNIKVHPLVTRWLKPVKRTEWSYFLKAGCLILALLLWRLS